MYSFLLCLIILIVGYFIYRKIIDKIAGIDENIETPAYAINEGVDYVPIDKKDYF